MTDQEPGPPTDHPEAGKSSATGAPKPVAVHPPVAPPAAGPWPAPGPSIGAAPPRPLPGQPPTLPPLTVWPAAVWPLDREAAAPPAALLTAGLAGLVDASLYWPDRPGLWVGLSALAVLLAALAARRPSGRQLRWAALTILLFAVSTVRTAEWLDLLCVLAGLLTAVLTVTAGRTWTGLLTGVVSGPAAGFRTLNWARRGLAPRLRGRELPVGRLLTVVGISIVLLLVFGTLFASADPVFARLAAAAVPSLEFGPVVVRLVIFGTVAAVALTGACLASQSPRFDELAPERGRPRARAEWAVPLGALVALFGCFVGVQLVVLADGAGHVLETAGLSYADYARQGFWQLLAVTALTLVVVAVVVRVAGRETRGDQALLRWLLGALCVLAVLVVATALRRMWLYEDAYGFTRLRLLVQAVEVWLGLVFALICAAGIRLRGRWLPRTIVATGALTVLALAALNPDGFIADQNVHRYTETGRIDLGYLSGLSPDAAPPLDRLPEPQRSCVLGTLEYQLATGEPWYAANLGRARARTLLHDHPPGACATS